MSLSCQNMVWNVYGICNQHIYLTGREINYKVTTATDDIRKVEKAIIIIAYGIHPMWIKPLCPSYQPFQPELMAKKAEKKAVTKYLYVYSIRCIVRPMRKFRQ